MSNRTPTRVNEDGEVEKLCGVCKEWWPFDDEFFNHNQSGNLSSPCKACCLEMRERASQKPCNVPGCPKPRYGKGVSAYCREHHYEIRLKRPAPPPKPQRTRRLKAELR